LDRALARDDLAAQAQDKFCGDSLTMETGSGVSYVARDWETAAQEAAFDGLCFCMTGDGRFVNRHAMPDGTPHRNRFSLSGKFFGQFARYERTTG